MRLISLTVILLAELLILFLHSTDLSAAKLSMISTLVVVVISAFASSALLRNIKNLKLSRNYLISGIFGVIISIVYYIWSANNLEVFAKWLRGTGTHLLFVIIFLSALYLYFAKRKSKSSVSEA